MVGNNMEYPAHKLILCASSDVFQIMLHDSKWSESNEKRVTLGETPSCAAVFEDFLKYLYTGKIHLNYCTVVPIVMPCPFTGTKMFCAGPNFLNQPKNLFTYCASHKHFVPDKKMICIQQNCFLCRHKSF